MLGGVLGLLWSHFWPGAQPGIFALLGAGAVVGATTQGPISAVVSMMELTGRDRSFILPMLLVVGMATLTARSVDARSIYDARPVSYTHLDPANLSCRRYLEAGSIRRARPGRGRAIGAYGDRTRTQDASQIEGRNLRRAWRRALVGRVLPSDRPELCFVFTISRADSPSGCRAGSGFGQDEG